MRIRILGARVIDPSSGFDQQADIYIESGKIVAIGHIPNTGPFTPPLEVDEGGYFKAAAGSQVQTNVPGIYVAGDCSDHVYRQAITAAGMGCAAAIEAERWLAEHHG